MHTIITAVLINTHMMTTKNVKIHLHLWFLIFNKLPGKKSMWKQDPIWHQIYYLDSLPLIIKVTPIIYFTTEKYVRSYNPLVFSPTNFTTIFFSKISFLSLYYTCCTNGILWCTTDVPSQAGLLSVPASGG